MKHTTKRTMNHALFGVAAASLLAAAGAAWAVGVGDEAPLFSLPDTENEIVHLREYRGHPAVLVFYRGFF